MPSTTFTRTMNTSYDKRHGMSLPPAQAEALYDAALLNAPRVHGLSAGVVPPRLLRELLEWDEDDATEERAEV
jgi:hypothetical protein